MGRAGGRGAAAVAAAGSGVAAYCASSGAPIRQDANAKDTGRPADTNDDTLRILLSKNVSGPHIAEEDDWRKTVGGYGGRFWRMGVVVGWEEFWETKNNRPYDLHLEGSKLGLYKNGMTLNDLLNLQGIDPANVIVLRHTLQGPLSTDLLGRLVDVRPAAFELYQSIQGGPTAAAISSLAGRGYIASFIGQRAASHLCRPLQN